MATSARSGRPATTNRGATMPSSSRSPSVSVVVVAHNEGEHLRRSVHNLLATMPDDGELIVVDDRSTDASAAGLTERYPTVRVVRPSSRLGGAAARNLGASHAGG